MKTAITLDYELYFGAVAGTVKRCLIEPTNALLRVADRNECKLVFFVDAGFIFRLEQQCRTSSEISVQFDDIRRQLTHIVAAGHDIQLHIHPHWEDTHWDGTRWVMDTRRYRIHQFSPSEISEIVARYRNSLVAASGYDAICAYRAGGWAVQPFSSIANALRENSISIDSSVVPGTHQMDPRFAFDFRSAPGKGAWRFADDPLLENTDGEFLEIPISCVTAPRSAKLTSAISKRFGPKLHKPYGDGYAADADSARNVVRRFRGLFDLKLGPVTIDGYKALLLESAYRDHVVRESQTFVVIGHPKAITPFALDCLESFLKREAPRTYTFPEIKAEMTPAELSRTTTLPNSGLRQSPAYSPQLRAD